MIGKLLGCPQVQATARYTYLVRDTDKESARDGDSARMTGMLRSNGASPKLTEPRAVIGVSRDPESSLGPKSECRETRTSPEGPGPP